MFSKRDPVEDDEGDNGRDVLNEKPSAEEVSLAVVVWGAVHDFRAGVAMMSKQTVLLQ